MTFIELLRLAKRKLAHAQVLNKKSIGCNALYYFSRILKCIWLYHCQCPGPKDHDMLAGNIYMTSSDYQRHKNIPPMMSLLLHTEIIDVLRTFLADREDAFL